MCNAVSVLFLSSYSRFILCYPKNVNKNKSYSGRDKEIWHYVQEKNKRRGFLMKTVALINAIVYVVLTVLYFYQFIYILVALIGEHKKKQQKEEKSMIE